MRDSANPPHFVTNYDLTQVPARRRSAITHFDDGDDAEVSDTRTKDNASNQLTQSQTEANENVGSGLNPMGSGFSPLQAGSGSGASCPQSTTVDKLIGKTAATSSTYRTGFGAAAVMKVGPDSRTWDGASVIESFGPATSDCPQEFGINPCSGHSTFPVGAGKKSPIFGDMPPARNRFYDFHETRWKGGSLLHDRNPQGKNTCKIECEQHYSCQGTEIGKHKITRTFSKGKSGSTNVTLVEVTKT